MSKSVPEAPEGCALHRSSCRFRICHRKPRPVGSKFADRRIRAILGYWCVCVSPGRASALPMS
eukprot:5047134-Alexandrium_andersonii.AAC.1